LRSRYLKQEYCSFKHITVTTVTQGNGIRHSINNNKNRVKMCQSNKNKSKCHIYTYMYIQTILSPIPYILFITILLWMDHILTSSDGRKQLTWIHDNKIVLHTCVHVVTMLKWSLLDLIGFKWTVWTVCLIY
jgi:hypothetical protein